MKHRALAFVASLLLLGVLAAPALANTTAVDQKMELTATNFMGATTFAQTFTSGYAAPLSGVDLYLWNASSMVVTVSIRPLDPITKYPTNTSYSTGSATIKAAAWYHFSTPVDISKGAQYAIVFTLPAGGGLYGATTNQYSGGSALVKNTTWGPHYNANTDFAFRTWVSLPNPTAVPLPTAVPTPVPTAAPVATAQPVATSSPSPSPSAVPSPSDSPSASPNLTAAASVDSSESPITAAGSDGDSGGSDGAPIVLIVGGVALLGIAGGAAGAYLLMRRKALAPKDVPPAQ